MQENILSVETDPIVMHIYIVQPAFLPLIAAALVQLPINSSQAQPACQPGPAPPLSGWRPVHSCSAAGLARLVRLRDMEMRADTRQFHRRQS